MTDFYTKMKQLGLANQPNWTISTKDKAPIDPQTGLKQHFDPKKYNPYLASHDPDHFWGNLASNPNHTLVTLDQLFNEPNTPTNDFALRVNVDTQHIILVDIEKIYDHKIDNLLKQLPFVYGERSRHGGLHFIVKVDPKLIDNPKYQKLFIKTGHKIATTKDKHSGAEFFFHDHYLTFTENQVNVTNHNQLSGIKPLLDYMLKTTSQQKIKNNKFVADAPQLNSHNVDIDTLMVSRHITSGYDEDYLIRLSKAYNDPNFEGNYEFPMGKHEDNPDYPKGPDKSQSYRDYRIALAICRCALRMMVTNYSDNSMTSDNSNLWLKDPHSPYDPNIILQAIILVSNTYLKPRPKLNHVIAAQHQTYQQYTCSTAFNYCLQHSKYKDNYLNKFKEHGFNLDAKHNHQVRIQHIKDYSAHPNQIHVNC